MCAFITEQRIPRWPLYMTYTPFTSNFDLHFFCGSSEPEISMVGGPCLTYYTDGKIPNNKIGSIREWYQYRK